MATTEELVALLEATTGGTRLEAARELATHALSPELAARVGALFTTIAGDEWDIRWPLRIAARGVVASSQALGANVAKRALAVAEATTDRSLRSSSLTATTHFFGATSRVLREEIVISRREAIDDARRSQRADDRVSLQITRALAIARESARTSASRRK